MRNRSTLIPCALLTFLGFTGLAKADMCNISSNPGLAGTETCIVSQGGPGSPNQFSMTQFDPKLGQLQSVVGQFGFPSASGMVSFVYDGIPDGCAGSHLLECASLAMDIAYGVSVSSPGLPTSNLGGTAVVDYCCTAGLQTQPWLDSTLQVANWNYDSAHSAPFVGTGNITFDIASSVSATVESGPGSITGATIDPINFQADIVYNFTAAEAPEPSLFLSTAGLFGGVLLARSRWESNRRFDRSEALHQTSWFD